MKTETTNFNVEPESDHIVFSTNDETPYVYKVSMKNLSDIMVMVSVGTFTIYTDFYEYKNGDLKSDNDRLPDWIKTHIIKEAKRIEKIKAFL